MKFQLPGTHTIPGAGAAGTASSRTGGGAMGAATTDVVGGTTDAGAPEGVPAEGEMFSRPVGADDAC